MAAKDSKSIDIKLRDHKLSAPAYVPVPVPDDKYIDSQAAIVSQLNAAVSKDSNIDVKQCQSWLTQLKVRSTHRIALRSLTATAMHCTALRCARPSSTTNQPTTRVLNRSVSLNFN